MIFFLYNNVYCLFIVLKWSKELNKWTITNCYKICKVYTQKRSILQVFMCKMWRMKYGKCSETGSWGWIVVRILMYLDVEVCVCAWVCVWTHIDASLLPSPIFSMCWQGSSVRYGIHFKKTNKKKQTKKHSFKESCGQNKKCALGVYMWKSPESAHILPD